MRRKKTKFMPKVTETLVGAAGGYAGDKVTTVIEGALLKTSPQAAAAAPALTAATGILVNTMAKNNLVKNLGNGMAIVAMTELLGSLEGMVTGGGAPMQGIYGYSRPAAPGSGGIVNLNDGLSIPTF